MDLVAKNTERGDYERYKAVTPGLDPGAHGDAVSAAWDVDPRVQPGDVEAP
jgi:hypothetical protein